jgi:3-oxoacyl-[acyl-carrier protein] reductase
MSFKGKVAIVTGSSSGIGEATALQIARGGAKVVINYSKSEDDARRVEAAAKEAGAEVICVRADVSDDGGCRKLAQAALDAWGRIDILVNNAGRTKFANHADLDALEADDFLDIYKLNVIGPYQMIRACLPAMKTQGAGAVVNVSSIAGVKGIGSSVAYAASKGALNNMTTSLARALAPEIRVNAVCPGFVGTPWFRKTFGAEMYNTIVERVSGSVPLGKAGTPESVAETICFLASDASAFVTGETLLVDAGLHLDPMATNR